MSGPIIFANRIICPDGTVLHSKHRHDYAQHVQADGRQYFVDGGRQYVRAGGSDLEFIYDTITDYNTHDEIRDTHVWGKKDPESDGGVKWMLVKDMDSKHIDNVIIYLEKLIVPIDATTVSAEADTINTNNTRIEKTIQMFQNELRYRGETCKENQQ